MTNFTSTKPHPEWKALLHTIIPLLPAKTEFTYDELKVIANLDVRTPRGRSQFQKFRKHCLVEFGYWFACRPKHGYYVAPAHEHIGHCNTHWNKGRRQFKYAANIAVYSKNNGATPQIVADKAALAASCGAILQAVQHERKRLQPPVKPIQPLLCDAESQIISMIT